MIIRSQDKKAIVNFNNVKEVYIRADMAICAFMGSGYSEVIGKYSTEEKSIKVLDMIQDKYLEYAKVADGWGENVQGLYVLPRVFQIPQDSEV